VINTDDERNERRETFGRERLRAKTTWKMCEKQKT